MSKNSEAGGGGMSSLNLSLDGRSLINKNSEAFKSKQPQSLTSGRQSSYLLDNNARRPSSSSSASNKIPIPNRIHSNRDGQSSYRLGNKKSANLNRNVLLNKGKDEKDSVLSRRPSETSEPKDSFVFKPLSQRSSTDSEDATAASYLNKQLHPTTKTDDPLDIFFRSNDENPSEPPRPTPQPPHNKSNILKEEKFVRLKESTDSLRRQLRLDTASLSSPSSSPPRQANNDENSEKTAAAAKIQTWYRQNQERRQTRKQDEIKRLLKEKNTEMVKKMERFNHMIGSDSVSKKSKTATNALARKPTTQSEPKEEQKSAKERSTPPPPASMAPLKEAGDNRPLVSARTVSTNLAADRIEPLKMTTNEQQQQQQPMKNSAKNSTIESLLMDLEKIDRESELLLTTANSTSSESRTKEKSNSLLDFLDEVSKKNTGMTPRALKDYKNFENDAVQFLKANQIVTGDSPPLPPHAPPLSSRGGRVKEPLPSSTSTTTMTSAVDKPTTSVSTKPVGKESGVAASSSRPTTEKKVVKSDSVSSEEMLSKARAVQNDLKSKLTSLTHELDERSKQISKLEKDLNSQRELTIRHAQEADKEMQQRLEVQKNDYEATIQRHLNFIDQLIDDKKVLSEKCEKLVNELKEAEKRYTDRMRTLEEKFKTETQRSRETLEAAEKLRREKWIEEKTRKIKEMTVKGLEPEIQALINKHKSEIKSLKTVHEAELMQADERAAQRYIKITEELRENYEREKEAAVQRERDVSKQRYEKSLQDEENSFLEQRRRLYAEIEEEKNRLAEQAATQRRELDRQRKMLEENNLNAIETIRKEYQNAQKEAEKKHETEIKQLREKLDIEKESWEQNFLKKQENWKIQKERELRDQVKRERDKEIETLIARLDAEATTSREEIERTAENRVKRIRDKYESELREVEKTERETMERYNSLKAKFNEMEGEYERLKTVVRAKEKDLEGIKKLTDTLQEERNRLADVLRQEFADRIVFAEEENKRLKLEIAEMKSKNQYELEKRRDEVERLQRDNAEELNKVHEKIKQVVSKKDEAYGQLKQQLEAANKRADHLEGLLEQQRALMLRKANEGGGGGGGNK